MNLSGGTWSSLPRTLKVCPLEPTAVRSTQSHVWYNYILMFKSKANIWIYEPFSRGIINAILLQFLIKYKLFEGCFFSISNTTRQDTTWHDMTWHDTIRHDTIWHNTIRYDTIKHDALWYDLLLTHQVKVKSRLI